MTNPVTLRPLTLGECEQVRLWRNDPSVLPMLRTKAPVTAEQQAAFYRDVVCNPKAPHKYYALVSRVEVTCVNDQEDKFVVGPFVGMGGLTYLNRTPGEAEISLILGPEFRHHGLGTAAVNALLAEAFGLLRLKAVIGECYHGSSARGFWGRMLWGVRADLSSWDETETALTWRWVPRTVAA